MNNLEGIQASYLKNFMRPNFVKVTGEQLLKEGHFEQTVTVLLGILNEVTEALSSMKHSKFSDKISPSTDQYANESYKGVAFQTGH